MGLFSGSFEYYAYAGSMQLLDDDPVDGQPYPNTFRSMVVSAAREPTMGMDMAVKLTLQTDMHSRARAFKNYAERYYDYGLPSHNSWFYTVDTGVLTNAIQNSTGETVDEIISMFVGGRVDEFFMKYLLKYNFDDNRWFDWSAHGAPPDPVWDETKASVYIPVWTGSAYEYVTNKPIFVLLEEQEPDAPPLPGERFLVEFEYADGTYRTSATFNLGQFDKYNTQYVQVRYVDAARPTEIQYWYYVVGSNADPVLEASLDAVEDTRGFLPACIMMRDKVWYDEDPYRPQLVDQTTRLLKKLSINPADVKEQFLAQEAEDENSGKGAEKWDFFVHFAAPLRSNYQATRQYFYEFFRMRAGFEGNTYQDYQDYLYAWYNGPVKLPQPIKQIDIQSGGSEGYNVSYRWSYIHVETKPGIYQVDNAPLKAGNVHMAFYERIDDSGTAYRVGIDEVHGGGSLIGEYGSGTRKGYHDYFVITRQNAPDKDGFSSYEQVLVMGLSMVYVINTRIPDGGGYRFRYAEPLMFGDDEETREFVIPIDLLALRQMPAIRREELLCDSLRGTVFLVDRVKVPWYQSTFFKWLIVIVAIIIIILAWQYELIPALAAAIAGAVGGSIIVFWIAFAVLSFAFGAIIAMAGQIIGGKAGMAFTIFGMLVLGASSSGNPGDIFSALTNSWHNMVTHMTWSSAMGFLAAIQPYLRFATSVYYEREMDKLEAELEDFEKTMEEKQAELDAAWDSLGSPLGIDPIYLTRPIRSGAPEAPSDFYNRTLTSNPGVLAYNVLEHFHEIALTLPKDTEETNIIENMFINFERQRGMT